ncbi:hypothetical protein BpHYR1_022420 [Brachionus plicatilis]|uniref:Uncharacterized protein n=1 Tax=Brachionus plicatilis TaxID=10195 RepID=A0A3M7PDH0_BRAPC|nr:hypothetical protein BpHYR1_022420 [Brachionus plicatilis]
MFLFRLFKIDQFCQDFCLKLALGACSLKLVKIKVIKKLENEKKTILFVVFYVKDLILRYFINSLNKTCLLNYDLTNLNFYNLNQQPGSLGK